MVVCVFILSRMTQWDALVYFTALVCSERELIWKQQKCILVTQAIYREVHTHVLLEGSDP